MSEPVFVIVGHVNRGKSSIVSTLAADDSVRIDPTPGTTQQTRRYPMRLDGRTLYTLIDTPGFERARRVLSWLKARERSTAQRGDLVRRFVEEHEPAGRFRQECRLLRPILDGAAVLYIVDGSVPFSEAYEAEMEILRWTARPRMALINPIGEQDHIEPWRRVLEQYFSMVRIFNAHRADFHARIELLRTLRELSEPWRGPIDRAIDALLDDRRHVLRDSAALIAEALAEMLTAVEEKKLGPDDDPAAHKPALAERYYERLRRIEDGLRRRLRQAYQHHVLRVEQAGEAAEQEAGDDLFDIGTWSGLGLSRRQLAAGGGAAGALVGGGVDAALGGASFLLGAAIGGAIGAGSSWLAWGKLAEVRLLGRPMGGRLLRIGPMRHPNFPWVALDRALIYHRIVAHHAHARRETVRVEEQGAPPPPPPPEVLVGGQGGQGGGGGRVGGGAGGIVASLPAERRAAIEKCFARLRKRPGGAETDALRRELTEQIEHILTDMDEHEAGREKAL